MTVAGILLRTRIPLRTALGMGALVFTMLVMNMVREFPGLR